MGSRTSRVCTLTGAPPSRSPSLPPPPSALTAPPHPPVASPAVRWSPVKCTVSTWPTLGDDRDNMWPDTVLYDPQDDTVMVAGGIGPSSHLVRFFVYRFVAADAAADDAPRRAASLAAADADSGDAVLAPPLSPSPPLRSSGHCGRPPPPAPPPPPPPLPAGTICPFGCVARGTASLARWPPTVLECSTSSTTDRRRVAHDSGRLGRPVLQPDARWPILREMCGFACLPRRNETDYCRIVAQAGTRLYTISAQGLVQWFALAPYSRSANGGTVIAADSLGRVAHAAMRPDTVYFHTPDATGTKRFYALRPPYKSVSRSGGDGGGRGGGGRGGGGRGGGGGDDNNGNARSFRREWDRVLDVAFGADDRLYVLDIESPWRECQATERAMLCDDVPGRRRCRLYRSSGPIPVPIYDLSPEAAALASRHVFASDHADVAGEIACEWSIVADFTDAFSRAWFASDDAVCLAVDAFRCRAYVANATKVHVARLASSDSRGARCDDYKSGAFSEYNGDPNFGAYRGASGFGGGFGSGGFGGGGFGGGDDFVDLGVSGVSGATVELLAGQPTCQGHIDGPGGTAVFSSIRGCAIRTRPVDARLDIAPVVAAIRDASGKSWPPGVLELVEQYARGVGRPAASLVVSDHGNRCIREIELLD